MMTHAHRRHAADDMPTQQAQVNVMKRGGWLVVRRSSAGAVTLRHGLEFTTIDRFGRVLP